MIENNKSVVKDNGNIFINSDNTYFIIKNETNIEILKKFVEEKFNGIINNIINDILSNNEKIYWKILINISLKDIKLFKKFYSIDNDAYFNLYGNMQDNFNISIQINKFPSNIDIGKKINEPNIMLSIKLKYLFEIIDYLNISEFSIYHIEQSLLFIRSDKGTVFIAGMVH